MCVNKNAKSVKINVFYRFASEFYSSFSNLVPLYSSIAPSCDFGHMCARIS